MECPKPTCLVLLVHGLWGWKTDWHKTNKALESHNDGSCLFHISAVNLGFLTYDGIDVCGQRLAQEVQQLVSSTPSLTTISFIGHSMGGLIARYAIGLLADPATGTVAGLQPQSYISIATPHLGCSSNHPDESHWQDRPYMRWLAAAVAGGHLGGHEHLAWPPAGFNKQTAAAAPAAAAAATVEASANATVTVQAAAPAEAAAPAAGKKAAGSHCQRCKQRVSGGGSSSSSNEGCCCCGSSQPAPPATSSRSGSNSSSSDTTTTSSSKGGRGWPWTPFRSLVQLLGCDAWRPSAHTLTRNACCCTSSSTHAACNVHGNSSSSKPSSAATPANRAPHSNSSSSEGSSSEGSSSCSGDSSTLAWCSSEGVSKPVSCPVHLLDVLCRDVLLTCSSGCGHQRRLCFLSGLKLFMDRATYSSQGGDHLIPWVSSALLAQQQLPVRATKQAATAAAATADGARGVDTSQQLQLPVLGFWVTEPVVVEQQVPTVPLQQGQQCGGTAPEATPPQQQQQQQGNKESRCEESMSLGGGKPSCALTARLQQLQALSWRRFHVVWPRLCLGSSHCNIQYNGPWNFAGRAVVEHVCGVLLGERMQPEVLTVPS